MIGVPFALADVSITYKRCLVTRYGVELNQMLKRVMLKNTILHCKRVHTSPMPYDAEESELSIIF